MSERNVRGDEEREESDDDEAPWDERRWEQFMRESDLRSARFGEIFETVRDDPNRDRIIAKEMGWDWLSEALDEQEAAGAATALDDEDDDPEFASALESDDEDEEPIEPAGAAAKAAAAEDDSSDNEVQEDDPFADEDGTNDIPAYRLANEVGMKIHEALHSYMSGRVTNKDEDVERRLGQAYIGCQIAAAKISGGHAMGYHDDVLCGNIVNCKRGLAGAEEAEKAFLELKQQGVLPAEVVDALLPDVRAVIAAVKARIEELRAKVWW